MITKFLSFFSFFFCVTVFSQKVYFKYDDSGNQIYRGPEMGGKNAARNDKQANVKESNILSKEKFWSNIRLYPVPVKDVLTIDWNKDVDDLIDHVSLYEHGTIHWKFQQKNIQNLNRKITINMSGFNMGVYILSFTLKDGKIFTKNIIKN